jgi:hypothetical protein
MTALGLACLIAVPHATGLFLTWMKVKMNDDRQVDANLPTVGGTK